MKIDFYGATEDVTGSMTFCHFPLGIVMIDCGLTQGSEEKEKQNLLPLPSRAKDIAAVIITHAHLDHSGYLPRLVKNGFRGPVYCTPATAKLMRIILLDSAGLAEDGFYDESDVTRALSQVQTHDWHETFDVAGGSASFRSAGHILGAASVLLKVENKRILFSGDLGRFSDPILHPPEKAPHADAVIMESTYGDRLRTGDIDKELQSFLMTVSRESRVGIIASFAVARAQTLVTLIHEFFERHPEEKVRVVFDSPMMKEANLVYQNFARLTTREESVFTALKELDAIEYPRERESLQRKAGPLIIISSSGMLTGGRISSHLFNWKDDEKAILFLPGYQGEGTPGRSLAEGNRVLKNQKGQSFEWSGEVWTSDAFSSHADQGELSQWMGTENVKAKVFLLHGEAGAKKSLSEVLRKSGHDNITIPRRGETFQV